MTIQRWELFSWDAPTGDGDKEEHRTMSRDAAGNWVFYPDHLAAMSRHDRAVELLRKCGLYTDNAEFDNKVIAFLAEEPK